MEGSSHILIVEFFTYRINFIFSLSQQWPKRTRTSSGISNLSHRSSTSSISQTTNSTNDNSTHVQHNINSTFSTTNTSNDEISEKNKVILENDISLVKSNSSKSNESLDMSATTVKTSLEYVNSVESSTNSQFVQKLMTTLGLNYCPPIPPDLGTVTNEQQSKIYH